MKNISSICFFFTLFTLKICFAQFVYIAEVTPIGLLDVVNSLTNTVTATIPVGGHPYGVSVCNNGLKVFVTNSQDATLSVIDAVINTVVSTIAVGNSPVCVALTPDCCKAYVVNLSDNTVSVINVATDVVSTTINVGLRPCMIAITPDGTRAYVADFNSNTVSVINTLTESVIAAIPVGSNPEGIAITPNGNTVFVSNTADNSISVIDIATNAVTATIPVGIYPIGIAINPLGTMAYVTNGFGNTISFIDIASNTVVNTIPLTFSSAESIMVHPNGNLLYLIHGAGDGFTVYDITNNTFTDFPLTESHTHAFGVFLDNTNNEPSCLSVLPISLTDFSGFNQEGWGNLSWKTDNEINANNFEVQKSKDGNTFFTLAVIPANGKSDKENSYHYNDILGDSISYYRLKMNDIGGYFTYSKIIAIASLHTPFPIQIYPNPSKGKLNIALSSIPNESINWMLFNSIGSLVKKGTPSISSNQFSINIEELPIGNYWLNLIIDGKRYSQIVVKE